MGTASGILMVVLTCCSCRAIKTVCAVETLQCSKAISLLLGLTFTSSLYITCVGKLGSHANYFLVSTKGTANHVGALTGVKELTLSMMAWMMAFSAAASALIMSTSFWTPFTSALLQHKCNQKRV